MRAFSELFERLDTTTSLNEKLAALVDYFRQAAPGDAAWAVYFLSARRLKRVVRGATLRARLIAESGFPDWLVEETYSQVGDLAETIALLIDSPAGAHQSQRSLEEWIGVLQGLTGITPERQREVVVEAWRELDARARFLLNKLLTGELRVGVSAGLVERALARLTGLSRPVIAHRLMGAWEPSAQFWSSINAPAEAASDPTRPYPFCLASPLEDAVESLGAPSNWLV